MAKAIKTLPVWLIMIVVMMAEVVATLEASMIYTAMPTIAREFGGFGNVGWLLTSFLLVQAGAAAIGGRLGDIFGRRRVLVIMLAFCAIGSAISATAESLPWIIFGRAIQGASGAILPLSFGLVREVAPSRQVPFWIGVVTGAFAGSGAIGFVLGGYLADIGGWRWIFWITAILPWLVIAATYLVVPKSRPEPLQGRIDIVGGLLFLPAIAGLLLAITDGSDWGWLSVRTLGVVVASLALLTYWARYEMQHPDPLIDVRLLGNRQVLLANVGFGLLGLGALQMPLVLLMFAQQPVWTGIGLGVTATVAGLLKLPSNFVSAVAAPISGLIAKRHGARAAVILGAAISALGWSILTFYQGSLVFLIGIFVVVGGAIAIVMAATPNLIIEVAPAGRTSEATGLTYVFRAVGIAAGAQVAAILLATSTVSQPGSAPLPSPHAYTLTFGFIAATALLQIGLMLLLPRRRPQNAEPDPTALPDKAT